ncbi:MAG TPA: SMI1/KNR4 family protein [Pseudobdellovibrionaceae bacterium]|nr:SMI1/KNR4 family protein [Pseudobdellovibrionaceae bacterium]
MSKTKTSSQLESILGFSVPEDYKRFIDKTGYLCLENIGAEVYGFRPDFNIEKIPCVIGATNLNKDNYNLDKHQLVISHTGIEDIIVVLDTETGCVFEQGFSGNKTKVANSFSLWLANIGSENELAEKNSN